MTKVFLTRSIESNAEFIADAPAYDYLCEPLLTIKPLTPDIPMPLPNSALIFTSAQAVRLFASRTDQDILRSYQDRSVFVVGPETEKACHMAGFEDIYNARGNALELVEICKENPSYDYLYLAARQRAHDIELMLKNCAISCETIEIYDAIPANTFSAKTLGAIKDKQIESALFFSKRTAQCFAELILQDNLRDYLKDIKLLCISDSVLECLQDFSWKDTYIAERPNRDHMIALLKKAMLSN